MPPADGAHSRKQARPVGEEDEDEDRGEEPEGLFGQVRPYHAFKKTVQTLHQPFPEVLRSLRHGLHAPGGEAREDNEEQGDDPCDNHRIGHQQRPNFKLRCRRGKSVMLAAMPASHRCFHRMTCRLRRRRRGERRRNEQSQQQQNGPEKLHDVRQIARHVGIG